MVQPSIAVLDKDGSPVTIFSINPNGQAALADAQPVALGNDLMATGGAGLLAVNTDLLTGVVSGWLDAAGFHSAGIQITGSAGIASGQVIFEQTNDTTVAPAGNVLATEEVTSLTPTPVIAAFSIAASTTRLFGVEIVARYIRVRISTVFAGGTVQAVARLSQLPYHRMVQTTAQATAANHAVTATIASGTVTTVTTLTGTTTLTPGTGATNLGKAEDAVAASADVGVATLGVRQDALVTPTSASGDYGTMSLNRHGAVLTASHKTTARTYSATAQITLAAAATDVAILPGNATTTVQLSKIRISGIQTTAGVVDVQAIKRSTANSGGTSSNMAVVPHDSGDAAASSTPIAYSANPTPGTGLGAVRRSYLDVGSPASNNSGELTFDFASDDGKAIQLAGTAQGLAINLNGVTVVGGIINVTFEWIEF